MSRYTGSTWKVSRRLGYSISETGKELQNRKYAPGQHGQRRAKLSEYGMQLQEKQKVRFTYGVSEKQFKKLFDFASKMKGKQGDNFLVLLETRLDNVVYRMGLGTSRAEARQIVRHGHILVNGKKVNIPSYLINKNDTVTLAEASVNSEKIKAIMEQTAGRVVPAWIEFNAEQKKATIVELPKREEVDLTVQEHLIVELYSK